MDEKSKKKNLIIKIACIVVSFCLWIYITNVEDPIKKSRLLNVPVKLINSENIEQSQLALLSSDKDLTVTLTLQGKSSQLALVKPTQFVAIADLSTYVLHKGINTIPVSIKEVPNDTDVKVLNNGAVFIKINLDNLSEKSIQLKVKVEESPKLGYYALQPQFNSTEAVVRGPASCVQNVASVIAKCNIKNSVRDVAFTLPLTAADINGNVISGVTINPQLVDVVIPVKKIKNVSVNIKTNGNLKDKVNLKSLIAEPQKIEIAADDDILKNITSIDTQPIDLSSISASTMINAHLKIPSGVILVNSDGSINIKVNVDKTTEKTIESTVSVTNLRSGLDCSLSTDKADITVSGTENDVSKLQAQDVKCYIDLNSLSEGEYNIPLNITLPEGVNKVSLNPELIKVVLSKKGNE